MSTVYRRSCGMDVHKDTIVVCVLPPVGVEGKAVRKTYGTFRNPRALGHLTTYIRCDTVQPSAELSSNGMTTMSNTWRPIE